MEATLLKALCKSCGETIEFPSEYNGQKIECPHCKEETYLVAIAESSPPTPGVVAKPKPHKYTCTYSAVFGILFLLGGGCMVLFGLAGMGTAKSAFQETTGAIISCSGAIIVALAFILGALGLIVEAIRNK